jgi:hypothetical protein
MHTSSHVTAIGLAIVDHGSTVDIRCFVWCNTAYVRCRMAFSKLIATLFAILIRCTLSGAHQIRQYSWLHLLHAATSLDLFSGEASGATPDTSGGRCSRCLPNTGWASTLVLSRRWSHVVSCNFKMIIDNIHNGCFLSCLIVTHNSLIYAYRINVTLWVVWQQQHIQW